MPALVFGSGSIGFFAVSYTIMAFPIAFIFLPRLWSVCRVHNYVTPADFIRGRYGSRGLALAMAFTGILALMPYIALQLVGIQSVLTVMGVGASSTNTFVKDLPLFVAFLVLAIYTYVSGLRAPAAIAFVKDTLIYVFVLVAVFYIPTRLGGWGHIFGTAQTHFAVDQPGDEEADRHVHPDLARPSASTQFDFATLALGSAIALFLYPHIITGTLAAKRRSIVKRNMSLLPAYSVLLGLIALFGYMAVADPVTAANVKKAGNAQLAVPYLFQHMFPSWFTGIAFAGIIIGALVPAAIMAIAAANLFTRNIFKEFFKPDASPALQTRMSQWASLVVKLGALVFAVELPHTFSINLQLLGGVWILQVAPMLVGGLYTRWFHRWALLAGWLAGHDLRHDRRVQRQERDHLALGGVVRHRVRAHRLHRLDRDHHQPAVIAVVLTLILKAAKVPEGTDETLPHQYTADPEQARAPSRPASGSAAHRTSCRGVWGPQASRRGYRGPRRPPMRAGLRGGRPPGASRAARPPIRTGGRPRE